MENIEIINFKSSLKNNVFAPEWHYVLCESQIKNINFKKISNLILKKEKIILKLPITNKVGSSDGYTGLGNNSITARHNKFNVLTWKSKEIENIKNNIIFFHNNFLKKLNIKKPDNLYIQCWANVMRNGEQIKPHLHDISPDTYLGGHICVQCENTSTHYINPVNQINDPLIFSSKNEIGKITLFQNCIPHYTDIHKGKKERITIAFDLSLIKRSNNYIKLY